jgi:glycosyltransferase involved in cell wall biosynthesis
MRASLFAAAASLDFLVKVLVVPVAGPSPGPAGPVRVLPMPAPGELGPQAALLLGSPVWRQRVTRTHRLPWLATLAPATLAAAAAGALQARPGTPVHAARAYLAPLAIALAERLGSPWVTIDLDDDDEELARRAGAADEAAAWGRLIREFAPLFSGIALASPAEAAAITARHGVRTTVLPNAVAVPAGGRGPVPLPRSGGRPGGPAAPLSLLFAGNLSYWPNADAALRLVREILPLVRVRAGRPVLVTLAGDTGGNPELGQLGRVPGVRVTGFVPDLTPLYEQADVVAAPLRFAAGTRIKLLEAFSRHVPVVATTPAAAGLDVVSGEHLLIADEAAALAVAVAALDADPLLRGRLTASAHALVTREYSRAAVVPRIREFFAAAAAADLAVAGRRGPRSP